MLSGKLDNNSLKLMVISDDGNTIKQVAKDNWDLIDQFREESDSLDILQYAIKTNASKILTALFTKPFIEKTKIICERQTDSLISFAAKHGNTTIYKLLNNLLLKDHNASKDNLKLPILPLELKDLISYSLRPKGIAFMLEYYHNKKNQLDKDPKVFFALGYESLVTSIKLFIESTDLRLSLLFAEDVNGEMGGHRYVYRIEKYQDKYYIICLDSFLTETYTFNIFDSLIDEINKQIPQHISKMVFCKNDTNQQTDTENCSHFSLKNISKLLITSCLAQEIMENHQLGICNRILMSKKLPENNFEMDKNTIYIVVNQAYWYVQETLQSKEITKVSLEELSKLIQMDVPVIKSDNHFIKITSMIGYTDPEQSKYQGYEVINYRLPARFMSIAQSPDRLASYIKANDKEDLTKIRINKDKKHQSLNEYAYHHREGFEIKTPEKIQNRNYKKDSKEPEYIYKNRSINYFANKQKQKIVPDLFQKIDEKESRRIIKSRDASYLTVDPLTKELVNIDQLKTKSLTRIESLDQAPTENKEASVISSTFKPTDSIDQSKSKPTLVQIESASEFVLESKIEELNSVTSISKKLENNSQLSSKLESAQIKELKHDSSKVKKQKKSNSPIITPNTDDQSRFNLYLGIGLIGLGIFAYRNLGSDTLKSIFPRKLSLK